MHDVVEYEIGKAGVEVCFSMCTIVVNDIFFLCKEQNDKSVSMIRNIIIQLKLGGYYYN